MVEMHPVESSFIKAVGHHNGDVLRVEYKNKSTFDHAGVPVEMFEELLKAESVGKFLHGLKLEPGKRVIEE